MHTKMLSVAFEDFDQCIHYEHVINTGHSFSVSVTMN